MKQLIPNSKIAHPIWATIPCAVWVGMIASISFMEAWMKFRAPGITLSTGLEIGKLVFRALNKMEWLAALTIYASLLFSGDISRRRNIPVILVTIFLALQTFWLLPRLSSRADKIIAGLDVAPSYLHVIFIVFEVGKVALLATFIIIVTSRTIRNQTT